MKINSIFLQNFRNYSEQNLSFASGINAIVGANGQGKTNLLEALHLCTQGWSFKTRKHAELIRWEQAEFILRAEGEVNGHVQKSALQIGKTQSKRRLKINGNDSRNFADLLGIYGVVSFGPGDIDTIQGPPAGRRSFMDSQISQYSSVALEKLRKYKRLLAQRNAMLKRSREVDESWLDVLTSQLCETGAEVVQLRREWVQNLSAGVCNYYRDISGNAETFSMGYKCSFGEEGSAEEFRQKLDSGRAREMDLGTTLWGPHKDDLELFLDDHAAREFASQGQQRSISLAIKLAAASELESRLTAPPILILDDIFSELDVRRRQALGELCQRSGQVFIAAPDSADIPFESERVFRVEQGVVFED